MPTHPTAPQITPGSRVQSGPVNTAFTAENQALIDHIDGTNYRHEADAIDVVQRPETATITNVADDLLTVLDQSAVMATGILGAWSSGTPLVGYAARYAAFLTANPKADLYTLRTELTAVQAAGWVTSARIQDGTIATGDIADGAITSAKIADGTIVTGDIADGAITSAKIADGTIGTGDIADGAITSAKLADTTILAVDIADGTVTGTKIAAGTITTGNIQDGTIATADLADGAVTSLKIADGTIATGDLADGAVTSLKIADGTITGTDIAADTITATQIAANAITASELADNAVDTAAIADGAVTSVKIADGTIATSDLADGSVTSAKIADATIVAGDLADGAVATAKIAAQAVTAAKIADGAVGTSALADASITRAKMQDGAILVSSGLTVQVMPLRKWNDLGQSVEYTGGFVDLTSSVPGSGLKRYVLLEINSTASLVVKLGDPTSGTPVRPTRDPDHTALGFVYLEYGQVAVVAGNIYPWLGPGSGGGSGTGTGSPVGHVHGDGAEQRILARGIDEGFVRPTVTPSSSVLVSGMHYRSNAGQVQFYAGGTLGPFTAPVSGQRIDGIYLDTATGSLTIVTGTPDPTSPAKPAFTGPQRSLAYIHFKTSSLINAGDDGVNAWIEDARDWQGAASPISVPVGVASGGTGGTSFTAGLIYSAGTSGGTVPFTTVAAPTGSIVGTSDAQTLNSKTLAQATASTVAVTIKYAASPTTDLVQYSDSVNAIFGNVSQFKTWGMGAREQTGSRGVLIGGDIAGSSSNKFARGLDIAPTSLFPFDNTSDARGINVAPVYRAGGGSNFVAYGVAIAMTRYGGDTGTFATATALNVTAPTLATTNLAINATGASQFGTISTTAAGSSIAQEAWNALSFTAPWVNFGGGAMNAGYYKDSNGTVWVRGSVKTGNGGVIGVLPAGYRPTASVYRMAAFLLNGATWGAAILYVDSAGQINTQANASGAGSLLDISINFDTR